MSQRVVVVGAGVAGLRTAEALRSAGFFGEVVVVGQERHMPYNRPALSKQFLSGAADLASLALRMRPQRDVDTVWLLDRAAIAADLTARTVSLNDGSVLEYDGLVVATGLRPRRLPIPGRQGRFVLRGLDDAVELRTRLTPQTHVVIIGGGFIGCELAAVARARACDVTIIDLEEAPMSRPLGTALGHELQQRHERQGVRFRLATTVIEIDQGAKSNIVVSDGTSVRADVIVEALGGLCNVEWLAGNHINLDDGVLTDHALRVLDVTGAVVEGVFAVGDVARFPNARFDDITQRVEHWSIPVDTARRAGRELARHLAVGSTHHGAAEPFAPLPSFSSDQYDIALRSLGMPQLADSIDILTGRPGGDMIFGYHRRDSLVAVVGIGLPAQLLAYRDAIGTGNLRRSNEASTR